MLVSRRWKTIALVEAALLVAVTAAVIAWQVRSMALGHDAASEPAFTITGPRGTQSLPRSRLYAKLRPVTAHVQDPTSGEPRRYEGFLLRDVLVLAGASPRAEDQLTFHALDGYSPTMAARMLIEGHANAVLAVRDLDHKDGWHSVAQGSRRVSPAPFYLVWTRPNGRGDSALAHDERRPWPYQLVGVDLLSASIADALDPRKLGSTDAAVVDGFEHFSNVCLRCHSMNLLGGTMGPELNVPRNITEYRDAETIKRFVHDPASFRARTAMPAFDGVLSDENLDNVIAYLRFMKDHKRREASRGEP